MPTGRISVRRQVAASPDRVWAVLTDIDNAARTLTGVTRIERISGAGYEVGTRWRETRTMFGREATEEMWVAEVDPNRRTVVKARSAGTDYTTVFTLAPAAAGTDLTMTFSADAGSSAFNRLLAATVGRLAMRFTRKAIAADLRDIAARAETG
ncbi:SRPBCC family protein [Rhodococcus sp. NPDC003318]|uniref:SRPBCC family protein n=1 Tax=Rhodococcus sp. NPDC003318 TaxID=3364503 RepID=UPI0036C1A339